MVQTVVGQVPALELGRTMMHEHLAPRGMRPESGAREPFHPVHTLEIVERELRTLQSHGVRTIVDVTPFGKGRNPHVLRDLAMRTGFNIVAATGFYKEPSCPAFAHQASLQELTDFITREIEEGLDGSTVLPGIIKVGTSKCTITTTERKILLAAARAHVHTGLPITTHTTLGTMGREQVDLLMEAGVDPKRLIIGHSDLNREIGYHTEILKTGAFLGFDTIGKENFQYRRQREAGYHRYAYLMEEYHVPDEDRLRVLVELLRLGYGSQIVLSSDLLWGEGTTNPATTGIWGYSYLWEKFLPRLREAGIDQETVEMLVVGNPRAVLTGERHAPAETAAART